MCLARGPRHSPPGSGQTQDSAASSSAPDLSSSVNALNWGCREYSRGAQGIRVTPSSEDVKAPGTGALLGLQWEDGHGRLTAQPLPSPTQRGETGGLLSGELSEAHRPPLSQERGGFSVPRIVGHTTQNMAGSRNFFLREVTL